MNKTDFKKINDTTYFFKDKESNKYIFSFSFFYETSRINDLKVNILSKYMNIINTNYKTRNDIFKKKSELYNPTTIISSNAFKDNSLIFFVYQMLDPKLVKEDYFDNSISFAKDMFLNPYFPGNKLDKDKFETVKKDIYNLYINNSKEFYFDSNSRFDSAVLPDLTRTKTTYYSKEDLKRDLDNITDKDIVEFYNTILKNNYKTLIYGNLSKGELNSVLNVFKFSKSNNININREEIIALDKAYNEYVSKEFNQSILFFTYNFSNFDKFSKPWFRNVIYNICNGMDGMLFYILRHKYGLVYSYGFSFISDSNVLVISAYIDKKNKDKTIDAMKEFFDDVCNKKKIETRLKYVKDKIRENIYLDGENISSNFDIFANYIYDNTPFEQSYMRKVNKITTDDVVEFFKGLYNENLFFYVGDKDE